MKRTIVAILAFAPALLVAQNNTPAQPSSTPALQSALLQPALFADLKANGSAPKAPGMRISTGVVAPKLVYSAPLSPDQPHNHVIASDKTVHVAFTVSETGVPTDVHVVDAIDPELAVKVVGAVSQFRYKAGTLNGEPTPVPVHLNYVVLQGVSY